MIDAQHLFPESLDGLAELLRGWRGQWPEMGVWVLLPEEGKAHIPEIQSTCRHLGIPLVGSVFPALVSESGFLKQGAWVLRFNVMPRHVLLDGMGKDSFEDASRVVEYIGPSLKPATDYASAPTLFMVFDAMLPNIGSCLSELYGRLDESVKYAGVNAGSETFQPMPCLFDQERLVGAAVLALLCPATDQIVARHGYPTSKSQMTATSATGNRIDFINGRPAFDVYREVVGLEYGVDLTHENFYDYAVHYPLGLITAVDVLVRIPVECNEDGSLYCVGEVPAHSRLWLLRAPTLEESDCSEAIANGCNSGGQPVLAFYCAGRRMHFGIDEATREIRHLKSKTRAASLAGALSLGEIDSLEEVGFPRFHNACVVCATR